MMHGMILIRTGGRGFIPTCLCSWIGSENVGMGNARMEYRLHLIAKGVDSEDS